ncbi:GntR family transcriptional regulator [Acetobacter fallax]|uniref:UTRA domain-containing protein n=1 Tax=Acetobacter fallax TaxID=1737473 RepID=A0ABX0K546_9PROT|nr:GntR family transcriptional regulator [Acetobacter fallax]NHO31414.1 UTRA domain-containing protein [Acetobacter fallax]NHO35004.1 UTRA domain-containing protein [Acetobacter fallax]
MSSRISDGLFAALAPDPANRKPLYLQMEESLRFLIEGGTLRRGDPIPAERDLATLTGVSRVTVRKALASLVATGALTQRVGAGTFVAGRIEQPLSLLLGFSEDMRARGYEPGSIWLDKGTGSATPDEAMALGIAPSAPVVRLRRIRTADGEPIAIETAVVSRHDLPSPDLVGESLYAALKDRDLLPVRALQRIRAGLVSVQDAPLLGLTRPAAILQIERRSFLADGRALEVTFSSWRADLYDFVVELRAPRTEGE